jgi:hypothetical protein
VPTSLVKFCASVCRKACSVALLLDAVEVLDASLLLPALLLVVELELLVALPELPAADSRFWKSVCSAASGPPPGGGGGGGASVLSVVLPEVPPTEALVLLPVAPDANCELICCSKPARFEPLVSYWLLAPVPDTLELEALAEPPVVPACWLAGSCAMAWYSAPRNACKACDTLLSDALEVELAALAELALLDVVSLVELLLAEMPNCARVCSRAFSSALALLLVLPVAPTLVVVPVALALLLCEASNAWMPVTALLDETLPMDMVSPIGQAIRPAREARRDRLKIRSATNSCTVKSFQILTQINCL